MGTSIDTFFPREGIISENDCSSRLEEAFIPLSNELADLQSKGWFGREKNPWNVIIQPEEYGEPSYLIGEGPLGFDAYIYEQVVSLGSLERFWRLYDRESPVAKPLQAIIESVVKALTEDWTFAVVAGGMGDSDHAHDVAQNGATFSQVCKCLNESLGPPAYSWEQLSEGEHQWCHVRLK